MANLPLLNQKSQQYSSKYVNTRYLTSYAAGEKQQTFRRQNTPSVVPAAPTVRRRESL